MKKGRSIFASRRKSKKKKYWIQSAIKREGALSRQLGIPEEENIPVTLLRKIRDAEIGTTITNPTKKGKRKIKVTRLLKRRAVLALTLKRLSKRRRKKGKNKKKRKGGRKKK